MDSYNSKYPLEYYEIGTPYMFHLMTPPHSGESATEYEVAAYSNALNTYSDQPAGGHDYIKRYVGVVVGTCTLDTTPVYSAIRVMFKGNLEDKTTYIVKKFVVGYTGVFFDEKEWYTAGGEVLLPSSKFVLSASSATDTGISTGGIDKKHPGDEQSGGIDKKGEKGKTSGGIDKKGNEDNTSGGIDKKAPDTSVSGGIDKKSK